MSFFRLHMLPAEHGDCIILEYGKRKTHRVLVDAGTTRTFQRLRKWILQQDRNDRRFELGMISHVDADHIGGALPLFESSLAAFNDVWFNAYRHLPNSVEDFGPVQGERLSRLLDGRKVPWNRATKSNRVALTLDGSPVEFELEGGLRLTVLSPGVTQLANLHPVWERECKKAGLDPLGRAAQPKKEVGLEEFGGWDVEELSQRIFSEDNAEANGSSIAVLATFGGRSVLLGADAHPSVLLDSIKKLDDAPLSLAAFKVPHHGSKHNLNKELLQRVQCNRYLFSSNGAYFNHPNAEAVAKTVVHGGARVKIVFNYRTEFTAPWESIVADRGGAAIYPDPRQAPKFIDLLDA